MDRFRKFLRFVAIRAARLLGSSIVDQRTGRVLGRALLVPCGGKVHVIGLEASVLPVFCAQPRLTYWKQEIGFTTHPELDFPHSDEPQQPPQQPAPGP